MRTLKGQVAAEYLATYGWALLAMFAVVAILIGSGMLGAGRFTSEECTFAPNLPCQSGYFKPSASGLPQSMNLFVNITNTQGYPMLISECSFRLVAGEEKEYLAPNSAECWREVPQGEWFSQDIELASNQKITPGEMRKAYITYTFRNCQDIAPDWARCFVERDPHNTSGRLIASIRG